MTSYSVIYPEMGEKAPEGTTIEASVSHCGGFYIKSLAELSGRGIRFEGMTDAAITKGGVAKFTYHATQRAFDKLCEMHNVVMTALL